MHEEGGYKTDTSQYKAESINKAAILEHRDTDSPYYGTDSLYGKQYAYPIGSFLILKTLGVENYFTDTVCDMFHSRSIEYIGGNASVRISPHEHEGEPTEKLYQSYCPESFGSFDE